MLNTSTWKPSVHCQSVQNCSNSPSRDSEELLQEMNDKFALHILPSIIFIGILCPIGTVGNSMVLYIYNRKLSKDTLSWFIQSLAVFDIISCLLCVPGEMQDMSNSYTFGRSVMCKILRFISMFCSVGSGTVLLVVAIERHKKICKPFEKQISVTSAKWIIFAIVVASALSATPATIINGQQTVGTDEPLINGSDCTVSDVFVGTPYPVIYSGYQFLIFGVGMLSIVVLYSLICWRVCKQGRIRKVGFQRMRRDLVQPEKKSEKELSVSPSLNGGLSSKITLLRRSKFVKLNVSSGVKKAATTSIFISPARSKDSELSQDNEQSSKQEPLCSLSLSSPTLHRQARSRTIALDDQLPRVDTHSTNIAKCDVMNCNHFQPISLPLKRSFVMNISFEKNTYLKKFHLHKENHTNNSGFRMDTSAPNYTLVTVDTAATELLADTHSSSKTLESIGHPKTRNNEGDMISMSGSIFEPTKNLVPEDFKVNAGVMNHLQADGDAKTKWVGIHSANYSVGRQARHTTLMMVVITVTFALGYLPYLVLMLMHVMGTLPLKGKWNAFFNILIRSYFLNSVANPIIYSFCSKVFKRKCVEVLRCKCHR